MATHNSARQTVVGKQEPCNASESVRKELQVPSPPARLPSTASAAKYADWGIFNFKAVVAYDGTAYK